MPVLVVMVAEENVDVFRLIHPNPGLVSGLKPVLHINLLIRRSQQFQKSLRSIVFDGLCVFIKGQHALQSGSE